MKRLALVLLLAVAAAPSAGCFRYRGQLPGVIRRIPPTEYDVVGSFEIHIRRKWIGGGQLPIGHDNLEARIREAVEKEGGDGAVNVSIETRMDFKDLMWSALLAPTIGQCRSIVVSGDVIKFRSPY